MKQPIKIQAPNNDKTEFENFVEFTKQILRVPKDKITSKTTSKTQRKPLKTLPNK